MNRRIATMVLLALSACAADPGEGKQKAKNEDAPAKKVEAPKAAAVAPPAAPAPTVALTGWPVDASASSIDALAAKVTAQHGIKFKDFKGAIDVDGANVKAVAFEVTMATLEADQPKLTTHLLNEDFFNVAMFPTATFQSSEIRAGSSEAGMTHTITGALTVHGQTHQVSFGAKITQGDAEVSADTEFVIDRKDFGVTYAGKADDLIKDNVKLTVKLKARKPA